MEYYWKKDDSELFESNQFEYCVDICLYQENSYYILQSRTFYCKENIPKIITPQWWICKTFKIEKVTSLVSAPVEWLIENNYKKIPVLTTKEKKELLNEQKSNDVKRSSDKSTKRTSSSRTRKL